MGRKSKDLILLLVAVIALVAALYTFTRNRTHMAPPAPAQETAASQMAQAAEKPTLAPSGATNEEVAKAPETTGTPRNPFVNPAAGSATLTAPAGENVVSGSPSKSATVMLKPQARSTAQLLPTVGLDQVIAPETKISLNGIIVGQPSMAIIRIGEQRFFAKVGDRIKGQYRVTSIGQREVVLSGPGRDGKVILTMGGKQ